MTFEPPGHCPNCGEFVDEGTLVCQSCGSCAETGWNEDSLYDGLDLPGEEDQVLVVSAVNKVWGAAVSLALLGLLVYFFVFR